MQSNDGNISELVVFATYWNEIDWIDASLAQIDKINPAEIIICDGCFDPKKNDCSTDGTREIIEEYVAKRAQAKMIDAVRLNRIQHIFFWLRKLKHESVGYLSPVKVKMIPRLLRTNLYRLNQAATFNLMINTSDYFKAGAWFMTYDCDQFYSDEMIELFKNINKWKAANIMTSKELTFFGGFDQYTLEYEKRDYNNMPHRAFSDTRFIPTRHPARPFQGRYMNCSNFEKQKQFAGNVYHYHLRTAERESLGYSLGDRKPPHKSRTVTKQYNGPHPQVIQSMIIDADN